MSERKPYPNDVGRGVGPDRAGDHRLEGPAPLGQRHQGAYEMREIVNAILYQGRTGCQWAYLPHDLSPKSATYYYFAARRDDGTDQVIHELLRCQVRERARRLEDPTLVVQDTQSVRVAAGVPAATTGLDPAKRVAASTDWPWTFSAWSSPCSSAPRTPTTTPRASPCWTRSPSTPAPSAKPRRTRASRTRSRRTAPPWVSTSRSSNATRSSRVSPLLKRWRVKQTYAILILHRRLVRDYEYRPASSASRVHWAMTHVMARRLTDANTPTWREAQATEA